jgi:PAS domain S-box-containing protein
MNSTHTDDDLIARLLDLSPFPIVVSRLPDHVVLAINDATAALFRGPKESAVGRRVPDYYVDAAQRENLAALIRRDGRVDRFRTHLRRDDGTTFWTLSSARLVTYQGEPAVLTAFNEVEEQLAASDRRLAAQSNALKDLTERQADTTGRFEGRLQEILATAARTLHVDRLSVWRLAYDRQSIRCLDLYSLDSDQHHEGGALGYFDAPAYFDALSTDRVIAAHDAAADPRTRELRDTYLAPLGIGAMLDVPLRKDNGTVGVLCAEHVGGARTWTVDEQNFAISVANLIVVALVDDERREAIAKLADSEARARMIVDTAHDAFVGIDSSGRIVDWNAAAAATFGWSAAEVLGRTLSDVIIPMEFREAHVRGIKRFLETGAAPVVNQRLELSALHRSGREFPIELTVTAPTRFGDGYFFGAFLRDISERRERDVQLRRAKESAEAATRAKSEFLANMSHELRTPLNGVLGYAQLLQRDSGMSARQREALDAIMKSGSHLLEVINEILDLSKIEAGRVDTHTTATDLFQLAPDLRQLLAESARRKALRLRTSVAPEVPRAVCLDGRHLRQVLLNLLGNAIKFTNEGEIRLGITRAGEDRLLFEVVDTGVGIERDALTTIFDAFTQTASGANAGGSGLGLTISRHLVAMMGGNLQVDSVVGSGSRFFFTLPLVVSHETCAECEDDHVSVEPPRDAVLAPGQTLTALVADDSTLNRRILGDLLESAGARVIHATGGEEAIALAASHRPDVIFMDLRMPGLDGLEATRRLKADAATLDIPVIAVTASALGDAPQAARDAGCIDYLAKPIRAEALFAALQRHLGLEFVVPEQNAAAAEPDLPAGRRGTIASRMKSAATVGDVTAIEALVAELAAVDEEAALGRRIGHLAASFDFDALLSLADTLNAEADHART